MGERPFVTVALMSSILNLGIVGTGYIADVIATALRETDRVRLAAVASRRVEGARDFAARHGGVRVHASWEELIADPTVHAVYVATPTVAREAICVGAAQAGRHVLGDKPFRSLDSLRAITAACRQSGVAFMDATHFTHHPRTHQLRREMAERVGRLEAIRSSFFFPSADRANIRLQPDKEPAGAIGDMAWYSMRAVAEYAPSHPAVVRARGFAKKDAVTGGFVRGAGVVEFADGMTSTWDAGYTVGACLMDLELLGEKGMISMDDFVLDWSGGFPIPDVTRPVGFTQRSGLATPSGFIRVETPGAKRQAVQMLENFADLTREPNGVAAQESVRISERTQGLVDTLLANLEL
jgi:predicted dehydrogenase